MKKILGIAALAIMASSTASAADYYASISGLYGKGGVKSSSKDFGEYNSSNSKPKGFDVAVGSQITPETRAELAIGYLVSDKKSKAFESTSYRGEIFGKAQTISVMLNGYYDFANSSAFTPYVMAGVGYAHNKFKTGFVGKDLKNGGKVINTPYNKSKGSFAYQVGLGIDAKVADNVKLGIGYRFKDTGLNSVKKDGNKIKVKHSHLALAHVRFEF
ncbi:porin family protein [Holosporaceae bacterium 'Namur']|nr:porin family protein [Holosporaceae bacterium 'Namur']